MGYSLFGQKEKSILTYLSRNHMVPSTALTTGSIVSLIAVLWSVFLPFAPPAVFTVIRHPLAVVALLVAVLAALPLGPIPGVLVLVAVLLTFAERNGIHLKDSLVKKTVDEPAGYEEQMRAAPPMSPAEIHPAAEAPESGLEVEFMPHDDMGSNSFENVGESQDEKTVIPTISSASTTAEKFYVQNGLGATTLQG